MSQTLMTPVSRDHTRLSDDSITVDDEHRVQTLLDALDDPGCRHILEAADDELMSASELSTACGIPLSTTYRKLDRLLDAGLLYERTRIRRSGKHTSEYARLVDDIVISVGEDGGLALELSLRTPLNRPTASELLRS